VVDSRGRPDRGCEYSSAATRDHLLANDRRRTTNDESPNPGAKIDLRPMADRTFTLEEAQMLLPTLESLLRASIDGKKLIESVDAELQELAHRVFLQGGLQVNVVHMARRKAEREKAIQRVKDALAEIDATGVQVKDLDIGLLDFPCEVDGRIVLLCWKLGENGITHWHSVSEGFAGRKPIDERIAKAKRAN
ncbi:MAG: DUF2203 domain-containing protein, partial [Terriglobales bacterium]